MTSFTRADIVRALEGSTGDNGRQWRELDQWNATRPTVELPEQRERMREINRIGMEMYYKELNESVQIIRMLVAVAYFIGLAVLAVPAARVFLRVSSLLLEQFVT